MVLCGSFAVFSHTVLDKITEWVDQGEVVDVVFLHFAKAFDKVPHQRLLLKVASLGIGGKLFDWIQKLVAKPYTESLYKWHCVYLEAGLKRNTTRVGFGTITVFVVYK